MKHETRETIFDALLVVVGVLTCVAVALVPIIAGL